MSNKITGAELNSFVRKTAQKVYSTMGSRDIVVGTITKAEVGGAYGVRLENSNTNLPTYAHSFNNIEGGYKVGDVVYLIRGAAAQGDLQDSVFYILGLATRDLLTGSALIDSLNSFFSEKETVNLPSTNETIQKREKPANEDEEKENALIKYIESNRAFKISALVSSQGATVDYGLTITVNYTGEKSEEFKFNTNYFSGQPYKLNKSYQEYIFELSLAYKDRNINSILISEYGRPVGVDTNFFNIKLISGYLQKDIGEFTFDIAIKDKKNYLFSDTDIATIAATARWGGQIVDTTTCHYYWFVKDSEIAENKEGYSIFGGEGWRVLNATTQYYDSEGTLVPALLSNNKELIVTNQMLKNYENIVKCVFIYETTELTSSEVKIYNYEKESYYADFDIKTSPEGLKYLKNEDDTVTLTCQLKDINERTNSIKTSSLKLAYEWFINGNKDENNSFILKNNILIESGESEVVFMDYRNASFKDGATVPYHKFQDETITDFTIVCKVYSVENVYDETGVNIIKSNMRLLTTEEEAAAYTITSRVTEFLEATTVDEKQFYYWWIENNPNPSFSSMQVEEMIGEGEAQKKFEFKKYLINGAEGVELKEPKNTYKDLLELIPDDSLKGTGSKYYLFFSSQIITSKKVDGVELEIIDKQNYAAPLVVKCCEYIENEWKEVRNSEELTQINNFNELTRNGESQGLFYTSETYKITLDENPKNEKEYYVIKYNYFPFQTKPSVEFINDTFINETYYLKSDNTAVYEIAKEEDFTIVDGEYTFSTEKVYYIKDEKDETKYKKLNIFDNFVVGEIYYIWDNINKEYEKVIDFPEEPKPIIYYTKNTDGYRKAVESDFDIENEIVIFKSDINYYEKRDAGDVYINASYIQTGALRIGEEGKEIFYANVENPEVTIGGFKVTDSEIRTKEDIGFIKENFSEINMEYFNKYFNILESLTDHDKKTVHIQFKPIEEESFIDTLIIPSNILYNESVYTIISMSPLIGAEKSILTKVKRIILPSTIVELPRWWSCVDGTTNINDVVLKEINLNNIKIFNSSCLAGTALEKIILSPLVNQDAFLNYNQEMDPLQGIFAWLEKLKYLEIPGSISTIPSYLINNSSSVETIVLQEGIEQINKYAFSGGGSPSKIINIIIPHSIQKIDSSFIDNDNKKYNIYYNGTSTDWEKISSEDNDKTLSSILLTRNNINYYFYSENENAQETGKYWNYEKNGFLLSSNNEYVVQMRNFWITKDGYVNQDKGKIGRFYFDLNKIYSYQNKLHNHYGLQSEEIVMESFISDINFSLEADKILFNCPYQKSELNFSKLFLENDYISTTSLTLTPRYYLNGWLSDESYSHSVENFNTRLYNNILIGYPELNFMALSSQTADHYLFLDHYIYSTFSMNKDNTTIIRKKTRAEEGSYPNANSYPILTTYAQFQIQEYSQEFSSSINLPLYKMVLENYYSYTTMSSSIGWHSSRIALELTPDQGKIIGYWTSTSFVANDSDANKKNSIQSLPVNYSLIFDALKPSLFKYNNGQSDRYHTGFIAQEVEQAVLDAGLTTKDFAAVCYNINKETGEKENYSVRYEEFIALCVHEIQKLKAEVKQLKASAEKEIKGEEIDDDSTTNV